MGYMGKAGAEMSAAQEIVRSLNGDWHGSYGLAPGPGHSTKDRSMLILDRDDGRGVVVESYASDGWQSCRNYLVERGLLDETQAERDPSAQERDKINRRVRDVRAARDKEEEARINCACRIWRDAYTCSGSIAGAYLINRGITIPIPPSLRFAPSLKHSATGLLLPALVAAIQAPDRRVTGVQRVFLREDGRCKAPVSDAKLSLGRVGDGAVRLAHPSHALVITESVEDGLALMQMTGAAVWALPGTSHYRNFTPPPGVETLIFAPDADEAGDKAARGAMERLGSDIRTMHLRPREGMDWCDVLESFEERAAIFEWDAELEQSAAELAAFSELTGGELRYET